MWFILEGCLNGKVPLSKGHILEQHIEQTFSAGIRSLKQSGVLVV